VSAGGPAATHAIGVIGAGWMGRQHLDLVRSSPRTRIAAVCDPFASDVGAEYGVTHYADHIEMLDRERLDGVIIANPTDRHVSTALDALDRGVPALVEKPVATSVDEGGMLAERVERTGVPVLVGHQRRHHPMVRRAKELIDEGALGRIVAVTVLAQVYKPDDYFDAAWRREPGSGGVVAINLVHDIDEVRYLCGEIDRVAAVRSTAVRGFGVEDTIVATLEFANGALGTLTASDTTVAPWSWEQSSGESAFAHQPEQPCLLIAGTEGALAIPQLARWSYPGRKGWDAPLSLQFEKRPIVDARAAQLDHFADVIEGIAEPVVTAADAVRTIAVLESLAASPMR